MSRIGVPHGGLLAEQSLVRQARRVWSGVAVVVAFCLIWEGAALATASQHFLATPIAAAAAMGRLLEWASLRTQVGPSIGRAAVGLVVGSAAGIAIGGFLATFNLAHRAFRPVVEFMRGIAPPLVIPSMGLLIGLNSKAEVATIAFGSCWPVLLNTLDGMREVDPGLVDTARVLRFSVVETAVRVRLKAAMPRVFAGLRIALGTSLIVMVIAEMVAGSSGIGYVIAVAQEQFVVPTVYGGVLVIALVALLFDLALMVVERSVLRWHHEWKAR